MAAPAFAHGAILSTIGSHLSPNAWVGALPAPGFFDMATALACGRQVQVLGAQRSPYNCRMTIPGREVEVLGTVPELAIAALPRSRADQAAELLQEVLAIPIRMLDNFLCATLSPSTSLLHPSRLYTLFGTWDGAESFGRVPLIYEEWDDAASEIYLRCDGDLQAVCRAVPLDLTQVPTAADHYGIARPEELTARIRGLEGLRGLRVPMLPSASGQHRPDLRHRLFREDVPFGIGAVRAVASLFAVDTPTLDILHRWHRDLLSRAGGGQTAPALVEHILAGPPSELIGGASR